MGLLRHLFLGDGRLPADYRGQLSAEGFLLVEEDLGGTLTYRNYRAPGRRANLDKLAISGAIAVTRQRVVIWLSGGRPGLGGKHMDVPLDDPRLRGIEVTADGTEKVRLAYDPHQFNPDTSGRVEVRLKTPKAAEIVALLNR